MASTLLGTQPPVMPARALVRAGALFGLAEGTVRTALSRMAGAGEVIRHGDGSYELAGHLVERQARQLAGRNPAATGETPWSGRWEMWVVNSGARRSDERAGLRRAAAVLRFAELRDGVWTRPDNLDADRFAGARATMADQARRFVADPDNDTDLVAALWDLGDWSGEAGRMRRAMSGLQRRLEEGDASALRPGFVLSASVLRHFNADPLLPRELLPRRWEGDALRRDYDRYDHAYRNLMAAWLLDGDDADPSDGTDGDGLPGVAAGYRASDVT